MNSEPIYENECLFGKESSSRAEEDDRVAHQRFLDEQLDWITVDHDNLRQELQEQLARPKYVPSMAVIDQWEKEMIERIRQTAILARRALVDALDQHALEVKKTMDTITPIIRDARAAVRPVTEENLREWHTLLQGLNKAPDFSVIIDKRDDIDRLILDLRQTQRSVEHLHFRSGESQLQPLISIVHHSPSTFLIFDDRTRDSSIGSEKQKPVNVTTPRQQRGHIRFQIDSDDPPSRRRTAIE